MAMGSSAPASAQNGCGWYGSRPFCDGQCPAGLVYTGQREACTTGSRRFCCPARYVTPGVNCKWVGHPGNMLWVCDDPILKFSLKNNCSKPIKAKVEYKPVNRAGWAYNNYTFAPGETGYLVDTKNRYIYVTAQVVGGNQRWARHRVDMGDKLGKQHTHTLNCQ